MSFRKYVEAADLTESIFGRMFGKKPAAPVDDVPDLTPISRGKPSLTGDEKKETDKFANRFAKGSLYQAINFYNSMVKKGGAFYSPELVRVISQNKNANEVWDQKYRDMFLSSMKTPALAKMMLDKIFKEMAFPAPQKAAVPEPVVAEPVEAPSFADLVDYIKVLLNSEGNLNRDEIKKRVKAKFPGLIKYKGLMDARIGKAFNKAKMVKIHQPEPEEVEEPEAQDNRFLKFRR